MSSRRASIESQVVERSRTFSLLLSKSSPVSVIWEAIVIVSILSGTFLVTFQAAFHAGIVWQLVIIYVLDVLYLAAIVLRFFTGYTERGVVINDRRKIAVQYAKTSLIADILSVLPLEIFAFAFIDVNLAAALLRLNRCIRWYRVWTFLSGKEKEPGTNTALIAGLRYSYLAGVSIHVMACIWYAIARSNEMSHKTWIQHTGDHTDIKWMTASDFEKYIVTLYWTVTTITSVGYGDILPTTPAEKWVSTVFMLWGIILFGYILGGLASMLTNSDTQRARYIHRLNTMKENLDNAGVNASLKKKVMGYYEYLWQRNRGKGVSALFEELPLAFQAELSLETYSSMIEKSFLFHGAPEEFTRMLSMVVQHMLYLPSQVILNKGDIGHHMYYVTKGEVEVFSGDGSEPVVILREGDMFGEINLVYSIPCSGTVRARTHCDILLLSRQDMTQILQHFPELSQKMKEEILRRSDAAFEKEGTTGSGPEEALASVSTLEAGHGYRTGDEVSRRRRRKRSLPDPGVLHRFLQSFQRWWKGHVVIPGSKFASTWELVVVVVTIGVCWLYSYQAGFSHFNPSVGYGGSILGCVVFVFSYLLDLVLVADVLVSMNKAIVTPTELVTDSRTILIHYLWSPWFFLDLLSVLPLEVFTLSSLGTGEEWSYVALLRLNRLIKIWKVMAFFLRLEGSLYISVAHVRALKFTFYILTATHIGACIWFPFACFSEGRCQDNSWGAHHYISPNSSGIHDYIVSLYWASATMTTVGYGDISAHNTKEMILSLVVQLIGLMLYGYCLGAIAATITNTASPRVSFQEKMQVVHQFMFDHNLGTGLLDRVDTYFTLLWRQFRGETVPGGLDLMHDMPRSVREDVRMEECSSFLNNIPIFRHADTSFLREVSLTTSTFMFAPGDIVLYSGDMGREMYCVKKGYVEILSEDLSQVVTVLGPGSYFGDLGFLFGTPRLSTVRAATHCELVMLNMRDMDQILTHYPLIAKQFEDVCSNKEHLRVSQEAAAQASYSAMCRPRQFSKPCTLTALVVAMATPLSVVIRAPIANTIAACVGGKDAQSKLACPISMGEPVKGSVVKYNRREMNELMEEKWKGDMEWMGGSARSGLRRRRRQVAPEEATVTQQLDDECQPPRPVSLWQTIRCTLDKVFSYCLIPFTFVPTTRAGSLWESASSILAFVTVITISLQAAFLHDQPWLWAANYAMDIFFFTDMLLKFHTAFYNKEGILITLPLDCAKHYLKTNFLLDFVATFPTDLIVVASWARDFEDILRVLSLARLNRLVRLYKLPLAFQYLESQIARSTGVIKEVEFAIYVVIGTHLTACGWFLLACASLSIEASDPHTCSVDSWALKYSDKALSSYSIGYQYVVSLYWATATTTTVGYGDIRAHTDLERVFASFVMVVGVVAYGYIIASVAASLANADSARAQYQEKLKAVKSYMADQSLDSSLRNRVVNYYEYIWQRNKGVSFSSLFQGMPISLQADISLSLYKKIIDQVPLFQNTEIGFTKLLALSIKPVLFLSKEYVVRKGDIGSEMFFINRGTVDVVSEDGSVVFASMNEGKFFGEISLVFSCPRTASIRAATNCDLFVLSKHDLDRALVYYPHIEEQIKQVAGDRANLVKKRSEIAAKAAAEGKSAKDAAQAAAQGTKDETEEESKTKKEPSPTKQAPSAPPVQEPEIDTEEEQEEDVPRSRLPSFLVATWSSMRDRLWPWMRKALTFTIPKDGAVGTTLHLLGCLLAYFSAFTITYQAAFQNSSPVLWTVNYLFEAYFLVEMFMKFHLAYEDPQGRAETNFRAIALHYLRTKSGFPLDLAALLPYEIIGLPIPDAGARTAAVLYLRLPHIIRVVRIQWFFSVEEKRLNQKTVLVRLLKFIVMISLCTHFVAGVWYMFGCQAGECHSSTWAVTARLTSDGSSDADHYCNSLYWAVTTMTTTGYGDLSATNVQEMLYASLVMVLGKLLFGFILGSIASTLANLDTQRVLFEEKLNALKDYMKEQHLSSTMQHRVLNFFDYLWVRNKGADRQSLLNDLPHCMQAEVSLATTEDLLKQVPIFSSVDGAFLRHLTLMIKPCLFLPGEIIVHKGDVGLGMFFLYHGTVEVVDDTNPRMALDILTEGGYFGQKSLVFNTPMESSFRAVTHVDMFTLSQADFEKVLRDHPTIRNQIVQVAEDKALSAAD